MNRLYNTQENIARDFEKYFKKVSNLSKPQRKLIPYIMLGMIESESVVTADIVKKLKGKFSRVQSSSTERRLERFFNNPRFDVYKVYDDIIKNMIKKYKTKQKEVHVTMDHVFCRDDFTILVLSLKIDKQRNSIMVSML